MSRHRARNWLLTLNNPEGDINVELELLFNSGIGLIDYATWQLEIGEEGTEHYQFFVVFKKQTYFSSVKKLFPDAHMEVAYDPCAARVYCQKEDSRIEGPFELGVFVPPVDKNNVWVSIRDKLKEGATIKELLETHPAQVFVYYRGIENVSRILAKPRDFAPEVICILGPPGIGKSKYALDNYPNAYWKQPNSIWWDGFDGKQDIILDDFYGWLSYAELLRLCDRYPLLTQTKGGNINCASKNIVITSNKFVMDWYHKLFELNTATPDAFKRRLTKLFLWNSSSASFDIYENEALKTYLGLD